MDFVNIFTINNLILVLNNCGMLILGIAIISALAVIVIPSGIFILEIAVRFMFKAIDNAEDYAKKLVNGENKEKK